MLALAAVKLILGVLRGEILDIDVVVPNGFPVVAAIPVMFMFASGFNVGKDCCVSCVCDEDGIPVNDIVSGATEDDRGATGAEGVYGWNCRGSEEFCVGPCSEMSSSHTPPLLDSARVPVTLTFCDENGRGCEATRVGGETYRDDDVGDNDETGYAPRIPPGIFCGVFSGGGGGTGDVVRSMVVESLDTGVDLGRNALDIDAVLGGGETIAW